MQDCSTPAYVRDLATEPYEKVKLQQLHSKRQGPKKSQRVIPFTVGMLYEVIYTTISHQIINDICDHPPDLHFGKV